jgi:hypothetical protein
MLMVFTGLIVLLPAAFVVGLLLFSDRFQRRAQATIARQIEVTDAIHAELGAVVSPVVRHRLDGRWQVFIPVELDNSETVTQVVRAARGVFDAHEATRPGRFEIVLSPREKFAPQPERATVAARAAGGESVSWT